MRARHRGSPQRAGGRDLDGNRVDLVVRGTANGAGTTRAPLIGRPAAPALGRAGSRSAAPSPPPRPSRRSAPTSSLSSPAESTARSGSASRTARPGRLGPRSGVAPLGAGDRGRRGQRPLCGTASSVVGNDLGSGRSARGSHDRRPVGAWVGGGMFSSHASAPTARPPSWAPPTALTPAARTTAWCSSTPPPAGGGARRRRHLDRRDDPAARRHVPRLRPRAWTRPLGA